ncbi:ABC transporter permease [Silvibacterium sp.]|uniref:ABC transporter permease n=1 Tax=Silvibacterium sp. TaxID=1964179 RepID=UPI0039E5C0AC
MSSLVSIENLGRDIRFSLRQFARTPGFAAIAIVTLALGVGVNTAIFSIVNGLFFSSFHIQNQSQMVELGMRQPGTQWIPPFSNSEYQQIEGQTRPVFTAVVATQLGLDGLSMSGSKPARAFTEYVSGNYFETLGVHPLLGRFFSPSEGMTPGADPYMVLSYSYWKEHFAADPNIVGHEVALDGHPVTIVGVAPREFQGLSNILAVQAWIPLAMVVTIENQPLAQFNAQANRSMSLYARLQPGVTQAQADNILSLAARRLGEMHPREEHNLELHAFSLTAGRLGGGLDQNHAYESVSAIFLSLAGLVLLLACVNVANLLLVRATVREREVAIRSALGARPLQLIRQMLTESILLALLGGFGGIVLGVVGTRAISYVNLNTDLPVAFSFPFDWHVFAFSIAVAMLAGTLVGIVPAIRVSRASLNLILHEGGRGIAGRGHKLRDALVTIQISAALALLIVAGLFTRSLIKSAHADLGFDPSHALAMMVDPSEIGHDLNQSATFYRTLLPRLRGLPGIASATIAQSYPMSDMNLGNDTVTIDGYTPPSGSGQAAPAIFYNVIGTDYFRTLGIPIAEGRSFTDADDDKSAYVAIVSQAFAEKYWPRRDPIGRFITMGADPKHPMRVVGVAGNVLYGTMAGNEPFYFYVPYFQHVAMNSLLAIELRTKGDASAILPSVEQVIHSVAPLLPVFGVTTLHQALYSINGLLIFELVALLAGVMGLLGLILAIVGVYGVLSYAVSLKTGEIGVRMALGAQRSDILRMVYRQGIWIVAIGLTVGLVVSFGVGYVLRSLITVSAADPITYVSVPVLLASIALLACYIPARRATRTEPMQALRID